MKTLPLRTHGYVIRNRLGRADDGLLRANPVHIKGAAVERATERPALDWDDVQRLASAIDPRFSTLVWVGATSGLRFGELTGLTRRHVDLKAHTVQVEQALTFIRGRGPTFGPPKSAAAHRTVTIPESSARVLAGHIDTFARGNPDALVFTSVTRFHALRHLAGTSAATAGASLREIMARMGQASSEASLRYLQASKRRDTEIADAIERRMTGDLGR